MLAGWNSRWCGIAGYLSILFLNTEMWFTQGPFDEGTRKPGLSKDFDPVGEI